MRRQKDAVVCQPLKTAWREADAMVKANLEARAKGQEVEPNAMMSPEERQRLDDSIDARFNFRWPPNHTPNDALLQRSERFLRKRTRFVARVAEALSILDKADSGNNVLLKISTDARAVTGICAQAEEIQVQGLWQFKRRHMIVLLALVQGSSQQWENASLTELLDYHEWVMSKALETRQRRRPSLKALMEADYQMRTKWMMSYVQRDFSTFTACVQHHRGQSAYLFSNLFDDVGGEMQEESEPLRRGARRLRDPSPGASNKRSRTRPMTGRQRANSAPVGRGSVQRGDQGRRRAPGQPGTPFQLERVDADGYTICVWFNRNKCINGDTCSFRHVCNYPNCLGNHPRCERHPVRPS